MADSLASKFVAALDPVRDSLYTLALGKAATPAKAELVLQRGVRELFPAYAKDPYIDVSAALEEALKAAPENGGTAPAELQAMPADVWARLAAAVQIEAAKKDAHPSGGHALNPDSVLLSPDPLLAPKKQVAAEDDYDLSPPSRFVLAAGIALCIGVALTIYILSRPTTPRLGTRPATASAPATQK